MLIFLSLTFVKKKAASIGERRLANALERKGWLNDPHDKKDEPYWAYPDDFLLLFLVLRIARRRFI
ncbi:hypothetical protein G9X29_00825 [Salmonella enterica subsp. enterica serovar Adjame]|nr:hypothetical protein G9X29_00825 [Salmonella enterica subsp. enterica serovar Adjame]